MKSLEEVKRSLKEMHRHIDKQSKYYGKLMRFTINPFIYGFTIGLSDEYMFDPIAARIKPMTKEEKPELVYDGKPPFEPDIILQRMDFAIECFKDWNYETTKWNSEHFARLVATDEAVSYQIKKIPLSGDGRNKQAEILFSRFLKEKQTKITEKQNEPTSFQQKLISPASPIFLKAPTQNSKSAIKIKYEELLIASLTKISELYSLKQGKPPICFISYAWGNEYTELVQNYLVSYIRQAGFDVPFDLDHGPGKEPMPKFLDNINKADFVVVVGTKKMLEKYNWEPSYKGETPPVVQSELIRICHLAESGHSRKIRTLLVEGTVDESLPPALRAFVRIENFKYGQEHYLDGVLELVKSLYEIPSNDLTAIIEAAEKELNHEKLELKPCIIS